MTLVPIRVHVVHVTPSFCDLLLYYYLTVTNIASLVGFGTLLDHECTQHARPTTEGINRGDSCCRIDAISCYISMNGASHY